MKYMYGYRCCGDSEHRLAGWLAKRKWKENRVNLANPCLYTGEQFRSLHQWQAHYPGVAAFKAVDESCRPFLNTIGAGLVERLAAAGDPDAFTLGKLAWCQWETGRREDARASLARARAVDPVNATVRFVADLMRRRLWGDERALACVRGVRPFVQPNAGFGRQLRRFEALGADASRWRGWAAEQRALLSVGAAVAVP